MSGGSGSLSTHAKLGPSMAIFTMSSSWAGKASCSAQATKLQATGSVGAGPPPTNMWIILVGYVSRPAVAAVAEACSSRSTAQSVRQ